MIYNYKNCPVLLNGRNILAANASISEKSENQPNYIIGQRHSFDYTPANGIGGTLSLNYYLTGADFLKEYTVNETGKISGNFGGLFFKSGYLTSYSIKGEPNKAILVNASIDFFDALSGQFNPTYNAANEIVTLNYAQASLTTLAGNKIGNIDNILSFDYGFKSQVTPIYEFGKTVPESVTFGIKDVSVGIVSDCLSGDLSIYGNQTVLNISLVHPYNSLISENYGVSGILYQRDIQTSDGQSLSSRISVKQNFVENTPIINAFYPISGTPGSPVAILGQYFSNVNSVIFNDLADTTFTIIDDGHITGTVPQGAITGPIRVRNFGGEAVSSDYTVIQGALSITGLSPKVADFGQTIRISGNNFYRVDTVQFASGNSPSFNVISPVIIEAIVPDTAAYGKISVISRVRGISGSSTMEFVPNPVINSFTPISGALNDIIIISGMGFSGITGVLFNNLPNVSPYTSNFTGLSNTTIRVAVPSGNTQGYIRVLGQSGVSALSLGQFSPLAKITGLSPSIGKTGDAISILGYNFYANILYSIGSDYLVSFNGATGSFTRVSDSQLTGYVPSGAQTGPVSLYKPDLSVYPNTGYFTVIYGPSTIANVIPTSGVPGNSFSIFGTKFFGVTGIRLSGVTGAFFISNPVVGSQGNYISATVPNTSGGLYNIIVNTTGGESYLNNAFTVLGNGLISGINPTSGYVGDSILVTGLNIYPNSKIYLNDTGSEASVDSTSFNNSFSQLKFYIPANAPSNPNVVLYNGVNSYTGSQLLIIPKPEMSEFYPSTGSWSDTISITGSNLDIVTGVKIGNYSIPSFQTWSKTGISFNIPEGALNDTIDLYSLAGISKSPSGLIISPLFPILSGFSPTGQKIGGQILISGQRLNTVSEIHLTGINSSGIILYEKGDIGFVKISSTGLIFNVPERTVTNNISIVNQAGQVFSSVPLTVLFNPTINSISPSSGIYGQTITISGANFSGDTRFAFIGVTGGIIPALSATIFDTTGAYIRVPREIIRSGIIVTGDHNLGGTSTDPFTPLPTISGINQSTINTGQVLVITGINATQLYPFIFATGKNNLFKSIFNNYTGNSSSITGAGIIDPTTGYTLISGIVNDQFYGTGKLYLTSLFDNNSAAVNANLSSIFSPTNVNINPGAPVITSFSTVSGSTGSNILVLGSSLSYVTGYRMVSGNYEVSGNILSQSYSTLTINPTSGLFPITGLIQLMSEFGTAVSTTRFTYIEQPFISGLSTDFAPSGTIIGISGSGLRYVTGLYFGSSQAIFTGWNVGSDFIISGAVPYISDVLPKKSQVTVVSPAGSYTFTPHFQTDWGTQGFSGNIDVLNNLLVRNTGYIGTILAGSGNNINGFGNNSNAWSASSILGGELNKLSGYYSSIGGGSNNKLSGTYSEIGGGSNNLIKRNTSNAIITNGISNTIYGGNYGFIVNGQINSILGYDYCYVSNGNTNIADGNYSYIANGLNNGAGGGGSYNFINNGTLNTVNTLSSISFSFISNGNQNQILDGTYNYIGNGLGSQIIGGTYNNVGNGNTNVMGGNYSSIINGNSNTIGYTIGDGLAEYISIVNGQSNQAVGIKTSIINGLSNIASGSYVLVGNGVSNKATGDYSTVLNGNKNFSSGNSCAIINGTNNTGTAANAFIGNGTENYIGGLRGTIVNGLQNTVGLNGFIGNGANNTISGFDSSIINGSDNTILADNVFNLASFIGGGKFNYISGGYDFIGCGRNNRISGKFNSIIGGSGNIIEEGSVTSSSILGGNNNIIRKSSYSSIFGGSDILITGIGYNFACGRNITIPNQSGVTAFSDSTSALKTTSGPDTINFFFQSGAYFSGTDIYLNKTIFNSGIPINPITRYINSGIVFYPDALKSIGFNHGLKGTPDIVQWFMVCTGSDLGYSNNDEIEVDRFLNQITLSPAHIPWKNSTGVAITLTNGNYRLYDRTSFVLSNINTGQWQLKVVALKTY